MTLMNYIFVVVCVLLILKFKAKWCKNFICLVGKTVIVTGANRGIGYECALDFAKRGARVIIACRNQKVGEEVRNRIIKLTQNNNIVLKYVDFNDLVSVRKLATDILETEERLDILVNNIGVSDMVGQVTRDGFPAMLQVNYYGHVMLTILLLDILKRSTPSRIVNNASVLSIFGNLDPNDLNNQVMYFDIDFVKLIIEYSNAKFGMVSFTQRLGELLRDEKISVFSVHPGVVRTGILNVFKGPIRFVYSVLLQLYCKTPLEGAQTIIYPATEPGIEKYTGRHFQNCSVFPDYPNLRNVEKRAKIFNQTLRTLGLEEELAKIVNFKK